MNQLQTKLLSAFGERPAFDTLAPGTQAPEFSLTSTEGHTTSLREYASQPVLLVFSSTDCGACARMYPILREFHQARPELDLVMISRGTQQENAALIESQGFSFPVLEWNEETAGAYKVPGTPFFYALDTDHVVVRAEVAGSVQDLEALAESLG